MKKSKIIALALAGAITFMGAGYAAWQDSVTIKTEVSTGNLDVQFCDFNDEYFNDAFIDPEEDPYIDFNPNSEIIQDGGKALSISVADLYPSKDLGTGSPAPSEKPALGITAVMKNTGTIPAKFNGVDIELTGGAELGALKEKIRVERGSLIKIVSGEYYVWDKDWVFGKKYWHPLGTDIGEKQLAEIEYIYNNGEVHDLTLEQFEYFLNTSLNNFTLNKEDKIVWYTWCGCKDDKVEGEPGLVATMRFYIDESAGDHGELNTENLEGNLNIKFNWGQSNIETGQE